MKGLTFSPTAFARQPSKTIHSRPIASPARHARHRQPSNAAHFEEKRRSSSQQQSVQPACQLSNLFQPLLDLSYLVWRKIVFLGSHSKKRAKDTTHHMSHPLEVPQDRIVIETKNVAATVAFWCANFSTVMSSSDMEIDNSDAARRDGGKKKKRMRSSADDTVKIQPGCQAAVRISPTTVLDIMDISPSSSSSGSSGNEEGEESSRQQNRNKRRKSPFDSIVLNLSGSQILDAVEKFRNNGVMISKVTEGTYGRGEMSRGGAVRDGDRYVSVHFCSPEGMWSELRTEDAAQLNQIREAALPSIQSYLRSVLHE